MTEDARQSLTAIVSVTLFFGASYFGLQLLKDVPLPNWLPMVGLGLNIGALSLLLVARKRRSGSVRRHKPVEKPE